MSKDKCFGRLYFLISLVFLFLWLYLIYGMSAKSGEESAGLSYKIAEFAYRFPAFSYCFKFDTLHLLIRKGAHFTEYGILALLVINFLNACNVLWTGANLIRTHQNVSIINRYFITVTIIFCCIYASLDEYHQGFVDGREPSVRDVWIDTSGACVFLLVFVLVHKMWRKHSLKQKSEEV